LPSAIMVGAFRLKSDYGYLYFSLSTFRLISRGRQITFGHLQGGDSKGKRNESFLLLIASFQKRVFSLRLKSKTCFAGFFYLLSG
jgi:hypothetical protein